MTIVPLLIDEDKTKEIYANEDCQEIFKSYPDYYFKTGYNPPWIGYLVFRQDTVVGVGGFTGQPKDGRVEIAYGTFKAYEGQGIASFTCQQLISISKTTDPAIIITAKTAPENNASTTILKRNGFEFTGIVQDDGIGDAWEWVLKK
jgi:ribosomal-protein-alanine N-acetyltransferase